MRPAIRLGYSTIIGATILTAGCADNTSRSTDEARQEAALAKSRVDARTGPTTNPSAGQSVTTDAATLQRANLAVAKAGPAVGRRDVKLTPLALFHGPMPTCFDFTSDNRLFVNFPRWEKPANFTVAEVVDGKLVPFPDAQTNLFEPSNPDKYDVRKHLVSVQSVVVDAKDRVWLLDTGSINMQPPLPGAPKMWGFDTKTGQRAKEITFTGALKPKTYLNDVRFDLTRGREGYAFVTDSGEGGIIVVDLSTGEAWRKLDGHASVKADTSLPIQVEGNALKRRPPGTNKESPVEVHSDGIAISPDGKTLYYTPLISRSVYAVPTDVLIDRDADAAPAVRKVADKPSANDGIVCDDQGRIYTTDYEDNAIRRITPGADNSGGRPDVILQDERLLWPDCVIVRNNRVFVTSNQLHRQGGFNRGASTQQEPFVIFQFPLDANESPKNGARDR